MIRRAMKHDIPMIVGLWKEMMLSHAVLSPLYRLKHDADCIYEKYLAAFFDNPASVIYVFEEYHMVIGYVMGEIAPLPPVYETEKVGLINEICVSPESRGNGIGSRLVAAMEHHFLEAGIHRLECTVSNANETAKAFWASRGYASYNLMCVKTF